MDVKKEFQQIDRSEEDVRMGGKAQKRNTRKKLSDTRIFEGSLHEVFDKNVLWLSSSGPFISGGDVPGYMSDMSNTVTLLRNLIPESCVDFSDKPSHTCARIECNGSIHSMSHISLPVSEVLFWVVVVAVVRSGHLNIDHEGMDEGEIIDAFKRYSFDNFSALQEKWRKAELASKSKIKKKIEGGNERSS